MKTVLLVATATAAASALVLVFATPAEGTGPVQQCVLEPEPAVGLSFITCDDGSGAVVTHHTDVHCATFADTTPGVHQLTCAAGRTLQLQVGADGACMLDPSAWRQQLTDVETCVDRYEPGAPTGAEEDSSRLATALERLVVHP